MSYFALNFNVFQVEYLSLYRFASLIRKKAILNATNVWLEFEKDRKELALICMNLCDMYCHFKMNWVHDRMNATSASILNGNLDIFFQCILSGNNGSSCYFPMLWRMFIIISRREKHVFCYIFKLRYMSIIKHV